MNDRLKGIVIAVIIIILLIPFVFPILTPPSKLNCKTEEINIKTGQFRFRKYIYFVKYSERIEDSVISRYIDEPVEFRDIEMWWTINTFGPFRRVSPYHVFHTKVWGDIKLSSIHDKKNTVEEKREIALRLLKNWQIYAYELIQRADQTINQ